MDLAAPTKTLLEAMITNVEGLNQRLLELESELDTRFRSHSHALSQEQQAREREDTELRLRLEASQTGGLHLGLIGLIWLFLGVLLSTLSSEISRWLA
jgi:hypothetical protein